ncbi:RNA polymerase sigma factor [Scrofimicrobium canadense]|uniref:RNA polymerase sigma factor n=1 Tax=Scrofimicrobium canadense TaxID=2652290 RepID=UPI001980BD81|nr:sigma-70 family RNA polymerase sigma factor [Scrofimicrobium canadense]
MAKPEHFPDCFRDNYPDILAFAARRSSDRADAEDIASETFTIAWRRWADAPKQPRPWLFGSARNLLAERNRGENRRLRLASKSAAQPHPFQPSLSDEVAGTLDFQAAWEELSPGEQEAIALTAWDGLSSKEAANVLAISRVAYSTRLSRARKRLREILDSQADVSASVPVSTNQF